MPGYEVAGEVDAVGPGVDGLRVGHRLPKIFSLLAEGKIDPMIAKTFPLLDARSALEFLAAGAVEGKVVLEG
jgi:NADPH:quinone reductase-like Zn-dependent oxidoreductase